LEALMSASHPTAREIMDRDRGQAPGFHFLRHLLAAVILMFHSYVLTFGFNGNPGYAKGHLLSGVAHLTPKQLVIEALRPGLFSLVGMFFGLSGFLVAGSAIRSRSLRTFFTLRVLRILPALLTEVTLSALVLGAIVTTLPPGAYYTHHLFYSYFLNIVGDIHYLLPGVFAANPIPDTVNGNLWTLPAEFDCYVLMGVIMLTRLVYQPRLLTGIALGALVLALLATQVPSLALGTRADTTRFQVWFVVMMFVLGLLFYVHAARVRISLPWFLASAAAYYVLMITGVADVLAAIPLTYCMVYLGMQRFDWFERLVKDDASYGIYLYGYPITQTVVFFLLPHLQTAPAPARLLTVMAVSVGLTVLFATLSWRCIEKPALRLKTALLPARQGRAGQPARAA
jgi:peptidoglycan/LPS O-acetylase OafA/YrhL